jgi:uncharacterized protein (DUF2236 family)
MKHCLNCGHITAGEPLFCQTCGRTYDHKLCPRLHANPRSAEVCSRCGSRELSVPQPKVPFRWRVLEWFLRVSIGISLLVLGVVLVFELITEILQTPSGQAGAFLFGSLIAVLAWVWAKLPEWLRKFIRKQFSKRRNRREDE